MAAPIQAKAGWRSRKRRSSRPGASVCGPGNRTSKAPAPKTSTRTAKERKTQRHSHPRANIPRTSPEISTMPT